MREFHCKDELVKAITSENKNIKAGFFLGVDGRNGAGKTTLAKYLEERLGGSIIPLDNFIENDIDKYIYRIPDLKRALDAVSGPVIIEGVFLLDVLKRAHICLSRLVYVKRMISGNGWYDEEIYDSSNDVQVILAEKAHLTILSKEIILYHHTYQPDSKADYIFERYII